MLSCLKIPKLPFLIGFIHDAKSSVPMPSPPGSQESSGRSLFEGVIIRDKDAQEASFLDESAAIIATF